MPMPFIRSAKISALALLLSAGLVTGCEAINQPDTGKDLTSIAGTNTALSIEDARKFEVKSYYSLYQYGPTQRFYVFDDDNLVLHLRVANHKTDNEIEGVLLRFADSENAKTIDKWINNSHSDGLYADAPQPVESIDTAPFLTVTGHRQMPRQKGRVGETYAPVEISFDLADMAINGKSISGFSDDIIVYVMIEKPDEVIPPR
jgi:hypothetical protein